MHRARVDSAPTLSLSRNVSLGAEMTKLEPEPRWGHESALIGDELYTFGGKNRQSYFSRNDIWTCNARERKKWIRRLAEGKNIPPPCFGAQCVVINGIIYSYGGKKEDGDYLEEVFGLNPMNMKWIQLATPTHGKKPWKRYYSCLWAIGRRLIMFGGVSGDISQRHLQSGAQCNGHVNNEIYEFVFEEGREKGYWLDVELSGERPQPREGAAMETIDQHRGLLHGGWVGGKSSADAFVIDLKEKKWTCIDFLSKPSARRNHRICRLSKPGFEERDCFLLFGGEISIESSDHAYILDFDKRTFYVLFSNAVKAPIWLHTLHCIENRDGFVEIIVVGGLNQSCKFFIGEITMSLTLDLSNEKNMSIESEILSSARFEPTTSQLNPTNIGQAPHAAAFTPSEAEVDRKVTNEELLQLAPFLIDTWKDLSRRLPGEKEREAALEKKYRNDPKELVYSMLNSWHILNGSRATVRRICEALVKRPVINRLAPEEVFGVGVVEQVLRDLDH